MDTIQRKPARSMEESYRGDLKEMVLEGQMDLHMGPREEKSRAKVSQSAPPTWRKVC